MSDSYARKRVKSHTDDDDEVGKPAMDIPPFWHKLNSFFLFPLQMEPLIYAGILALCSYLLMFGFFIAALTTIGLALAVSRYAFKVAALASRGITDSADYRPHMMDRDWTALPWKLYGVQIVHTIIIIMLARVNFGLASVGILASSFIIPATLIVLINTCSLRSAINPFELLGTIFDIGKSYLLLCLFLYLLMQGTPIVISLLLPIVPRFVLLPLFTFAIIYFTWVMAAMIGYVMYQNHAALNIDPVKTPSSADIKPEDPVAAEAAKRDAEVAKLAQSGDMKTALDKAREWQRASYDNIHDQRRYHRLLKLTDETDRLAQQAQQFIALLLQQQREGEALEVWGSCFKRSPQFKLNSAEDTLALARSAWKSMQPNYVLALLQSFEKNHPAHALTPDAQELIIRALKQGLDKPEQALRVFMRMKSRYPAHPVTQEAEWILRDELKRLMPASA